MLRKGDAYGNIKGHVVNSLIHGLMKYTPEHGENIIRSDTSTNPGDARPFDSFGMTNMESREAKIKLVEAKCRENLKQKEIVELATGNAVYYLSGDDEALRAGMQAIAALKENNIDVSDVGGATLEEQELKIFCRESAEGLRTMDKQAIADAIQKSGSKIGKISIYMVTDESFDTINKIAHIALKHSNEISDSSGDQQ